MTGKRNNILIVLLSVVTIAYAGAAFCRNFVWRSRITFWKDVIEKSPAKARPYVVLADAYLAENRFDAALKSLEKAVQADPGYGASYVIRGHVYMQQHRFEEAFQSYNQALAIDDSYPSAYLNRGLLYENVHHDYIQALEDYTKAVELKRSAGKPQFSRGSLLLKMNRPADAYLDFLAILATPGFEVRAHIGAGIALNRLNRPQAAMEYLRKAVALDETAPAAWFHLGAAHLMLGQRGKARECAERAEALGMDVSALYQALKQE